LAAGAFLGAAALAAGFAAALGAALAAAGFAAGVFLATMLDSFSVDDRRVIIL
jgi:hypothetical protein